MIFLSVLLTLNLSCATSISPENLKLELVVPNHPFFAGEIVYLEARLINISNSPIKIPILGNDVGACNYDIRVFDSGEMYTLCRPDNERRDSDRILNPGEVYIYKKPFYLCTKRDYAGDKRFRVKAEYGWKEGESGYLIQSDEKWVDVLAPKNDVDRGAYKLLYTFVGDLENGAAMSEAYSDITAYKKIPEKYPSSLYVKYALYQEGKRFAEYSPKGQSEIETIRKGEALLERVLLEYPTFHLTDETLYYLALAHQKLGEKDKALEFYNKAIKEFPNTEGAEMAAKALQSLNSAK